RRLNRLSECAPRGERCAELPCRQGGLRARVQTHSWTEEFPRRSQKRGRGVRRHDRRAKMSLRGLALLVHGGVVLMTHLIFIGEAEETFGVTHEQTAIRIQAVVKLSDQALLFGLVEVDHHVTAEDDVV